MKKNIQELNDKLDKKTVFIIAGGPSIKNVDMGLLKNQSTIAVNGSYAIMPNATALYWGDSSWINPNIDGVNHHKCKLRFHGRMGSCHPHEDFRGICDSTILSRTSEYGFDSDPHNVCGNNSGAHAINLAVNMGASTIVLLGYDMGIINGESHWHKGYSYGIRPDVYSEMFIPSINSMAKKIKELNIKVSIINANVSSNLKCFPFGDFENYLST